MKATRLNNHWDTIAHYWSNVGQPLRPGPDDCRHYREIINDGGRGPVRVLILGVTPELFHLGWPDDSTVFSADHSVEMSNAIWPGPPGSAITTDWLSLPFPDETFDYVLCDGGLHLLDYPDSQKNLPGRLARILKPSGRMIFRLFCMPDKPEPLSTVFADLAEGRLGNVHIFKLRTGMALQSSARGGIVLGEVYDKIITQYGTFENLRNVTGWPAKEIATLASYCDSKNCYHFLTKDQSIKVLEGGRRFKLEHWVENRYTLGERCPIVALRKNEPYD